jgi:hypothetical protein
MKRIIIKITYIIVAIIAIISCKNSPSGKESINFGEVHPEQVIEKTLTLKFNREAIEDQDAYVEFVYLTTNGEKPQNIKFTVDGVAVASNSLKFFAKDFEKKQDVKIGITFPKGSPEKDYSGNLVLYDASDALSLGITHSIENLPIQVGESAGIWDVVYNDPIPLWIKLSIIIGAVLFVALIIYYILTRDNMPLGHKTFKTGIITFPDGDATVSLVRLEKLRNYNLSKALSGLKDDDLILEPYDKIHNRKKKRFARLKNKSDLNIKLVYDGNEEMIGAAQELYHQDEIKIVFNDNKTSSVMYSNNKIIRTN